MVILRATQRVLRSLRQAGGEVAVSDNALGDWYVNRLVIDRRPLLLLVSYASRLAIVTPARDVKGLPGRLAQIVGARLQRLGASGDVIASEIEATTHVCVGKTVDRSVTGQLVDFAKALQYYLPVNRWDEATLISAEDKLAETPCRAGRPFAEVIWPRQRAIERLNTAWPASRTRH